MKRHSRNTLVSLTALALGATLLLTGCSEDAAGSTAETASAPAAPVQSSDTTATGATAAQTSELLASLTHEEMEELISGSTTLEQLTQQRAEAADPGTGSTTALPEYEQQLQALINQLYAVKARAESSLNNTIQSATAEYKALPAAKQTKSTALADEALAAYKAQKSEMVSSLTSKLYG